jgi:hypothetical protein
MRLAHDRCADMKNCGFAASQRGDFGKTPDE